MAKRKTRRYTRRRPKRRRTKSKKVSLAVLAGLGVGLIKPIEEGMKGNINGVFAHLAMNYTGCDPNKAGQRDFFQLGRLKNGLVPLIIGAVVHKAASAFGVNRTFSGIPVIGKYLSI